MSSLSLPPEAPTLAQELEQSVAQVLQQAVNHQQSGENQAAEDLYRAILEIQPQHADANHNLGVLLAQLQQPLRGLPFLRAALEATPEGERYWLSYIEALLLDGQKDVAAQTLALGRRHGLQGAAVEELAGRMPAQALQVPPPVPLAVPRRAPRLQDINKLAALQRQGHSAEIETFAQRLTVRFPEHGLGWKTLGCLLEQQGRIDEALLPLQKAAELLPEDADVYNVLGVILQKKVRIAEAETIFCQALRLKPDYPAALNNLGNLYRLQGRLAESEANFRRALELEPGAIVYNNLGATLLDLGRIVDAENCYRLGLKIKPDSALLHTNLGVSLRYQGRLVEAIASQRRALKLSSYSPEQHSNLLFTLNYTSAEADSSHLEEARNYGRRVSQKVKTPFSAWQCALSPDRLRVGLVSGDLYNHPVGFFLESLLGQLDPARVELFAYPTNPKADDLTARIKPRFAAWQPLFGLSDEAAAATIYGDGVHVLLDLSGHTSHNRLPMFVRKPAPVQVSWLGYFATTGVTAIDYFLADAVGVPASQQENFTESLRYLPATRLCFSAPQFDLPVAPLPALEKGYITFGCFQRLTKVGDEVLKLWSEILAALPTARLRWQCTQLGDPAIAAQFVQRLQRHAIDPARVTLQGAVSRSNYLAAHAEVDVILDTFPYPGGTTTCEALWMGVPTLTLAGNTLLSRQGASLLTAAGLEDWVTDSVADYLAKAIAVASDLPLLASLRAGLRAQVLASPLFDAQQFARNFEATLWGMWQDKKSDATFLTEMPDFQDVDKEKKLTPHKEDPQIKEDDLEPHSLSANRAQKGEEHWSPLLSVIITTHQRPFLLKRAMASIRAQNLADVQMVIVSDEHYGDGFEAAQTLMGPLDIFINQRGEPGPAESRNLGLQVATGRYIVFLDDDDSFAAGYFTRLRPHLRRGLKDILFTDATFINEDRSAGRATILNKTVISLAGVTVDMINVKNRIPNNCLVYPRECLQRIRNDSSLILFEDWDFLIHATLERDLIHCPVLGPNIHKNDRSKQERRGAKNDDKLIETILVIYKKWPGKTLAIRQERQAYLVSCGVSLPLDAI